MTIENITIRLLQPADQDQWLRMRLALWPENTPEEHLREMQAIQSAPRRDPVFVAVRPGGDLCGFLEASIRRYADGCDTTPVGYIEGWYVDPDLRQQGIGGALVRAAEDWARGRGYQEMGSDCVLDNETSRSAHLALGYQETERLIHFCKPLDAPPPPEPLPVFAGFIRPLRLGFIDSPTPQESAVMAEHFEYLSQGAARGIVLLAGPNLDGLFGLLLLRLESQEAAWEFMQEDPSIKAGIMELELFPMRISILGDFNAVP